MISNISRRPGLFGSLVVCVMLCVSSSHAESRHSEHIDYGILRKDRPFVGYGHCDKPVDDIQTGLTHVHCLGPPHMLGPGDTADVLILLDNPFPKDREVVVVHQAAQLVDEKLRPVPLSEVYVHHYVGDERFIIGNGAELRGSMTQHSLPRPYALVVNGKIGDDDVRTRIVNIQLINTRGVAEGAMKECLECWCSHEPVKGSFLCCHTCPITDHNLTARTYFLQHNVTFRSPSKQDLQHPIAFMGYDVTGGHIEYDITRAEGTNSTHKMVRRMEVDHRCPQSEPFVVVRCTAHQHVGGKCMSLLNAENGDLICRSCPVYGTHAGVPGDELGYVVKMGSDDVQYDIRPGTKVDLVSEYDASEIRLGVMGLFTIWVAGPAVEPCRGGFGGHMFDIRGMDAGKAVYGDIQRLAA